MSRTFSCYSCWWSIGTLDGLLCKLKQMPALQRCDRFVFEAGTDESERTPDAQG